jgi:hypothetical protein
MIAQEILFTLPPVELLPALNPGEGVSESTSQQGRQAAARMRPEL